MRWLPKRLPMGLLLLLAVGPCVAAPGHASVAGSAAQATVPDYGGRDAPGLLTGTGADVPDPAAQAGRALLSLLLVLGGVFGVVTLLKRGGYTGGGPVGSALMAGLRQSVPAPSGAGVASGPLTLLQSQPLPGGGAVHLLSVNDRTLVLVGATGQGVSLIAEWKHGDEAAEAAPAASPTFQEFLSRADDAPAPARPPAYVGADNFSDLLSTQRVLSREGIPE